jgi:hypothetical protein
MMNMPKQKIKPLGILLAVCFLMSVTAGAVSAQCGDNANAPNVNSPQKCANEQTQGKMSSYRGLSKGIDVNINKIVVPIKNLVIARNVAIFNDRSELKVVESKGMMRHSGMMGHSGMMRHSGMMSTSGMKDNADMMDTSGTMSTSTMKDNAGGMIDTSSSAPNVPTKTCGGASAGTKSC